MISEKSATLPSHYVITIGRSFGAGGRELGQRLAKRLGISYYDKELLVDAAQKAGLDSSIFEKNDERAPGFISGTLAMCLGYTPVARYTAGGSNGGDNVYRIQSDFIREIAAEGPCVIVGRSADYILRDYPNLLSIFLHAPEDACVERILRRCDCGDADRARAMLRKTNRLRAEFYNFFTDHIWGDASTYHLTLDSSAVSMDALTEFVVQYLQMFLAERSK